MGKDKGCQAIWLEQGLVLTCGPQGAWHRLGLGLGLLAENML